MKTLKMQIIEKGYFSYGRQKPFTGHYCFRNMVTGHQITGGTLKDCLAKTI